MNSLSPKQFLSGTVLILLLGLVWIGISAALPGTAAVSGIPAPQAGFAAPDFTLSDQDGNQVTLSDLQGQAVLVNVWASWCGPCRQEMPAMENIYREYKDQGFTILAINASNQDNPAEAEAFAAEMGLTFPILFDTDGLVSELYQVRALPSSFFVLPDGTIQEVVIGGPMAEALLHTRVENLLKEVE
jgi:peroxiredoxin